MHRLREFFGYPASLESRTPREFQEELDRYLLERYDPKNAAPPEHLRRFYRVKGWIQRGILEAPVRRVLWWWRGVRARKRAARYHPKHPGHSFPSWPWDETLEQRKLALLATLVSPEGSLEILWFWPRGKRWVFVITHDVETAAGLERIHRFVEVERAYGFRSSFHLVPRKYEVPQSLVENLWNQGFEVGIHGYNHDGFLFLDRQEFERRLGVIREVARQWRSRGFRSPSTLRRLDWLQELPVEWDSSCFDTDPFEPQPGGVLSWFPYRLGPLVELPITLPQDHLVFRLLKHRSLDLWKEKALRIREAFGMVLINVHPDPGYMADPDLLPLYEAFLAWMRDFGDELWNPLPHELASWWNRRLDLLSGSVQDYETHGVVHRRVRVVSRDGRLKLDVLE